MEPLNIAIFGSSGAIGKALCFEFSKNNSVNNIFAFSRNGVQLDHQSIISKELNYLNEIVWLRLLNHLNVSWTLLLWRLVRLNNQKNQ